MKRLRRHGQSIISLKPLAALTTVLVACVGGSSRADAAAAYTFGQNSQGQLGDGNTGNNTGDYSSSTPVLAVGMDSGVTAVAGGGVHSLAVKDGALYAWGFDSYGQLGNGTYNTGTYLSYTTPQASPFLTSGVTAVQGGIYHSLALANGGVYAFGLNSYGQLGNGTVGGQNGTPVLIPTLAVGVTAIAAGQYHNLAIQNGALYAWGQNNGGQIGLGTYSSTAITTPTAVPGMGSGVTSMAGGNLHTLVVQNGAAYAWGYNQYGQLGNNGTTGSTLSAVYSSPQAVVGLTSGVTEVSAGASHSLALANGSVYAWGLNSSGQLGNNSTSNSAVPLLVSGITGTIIDIEASATSSYALSSDGSLWAWGDNRYGELGLDLSTAYYLTPQHVLPPSGYVFSSIDTGPNSYHVVAILTAVPEPTTATLLGLSVCTLALRRRNRGN